LELAPHGIRVNSIHPGLIRTPMTAGVPEDFLQIPLPRLVGLYKSGLLKVDEMVTATYRLKDINEGYQDMLDGKNIRGVIRYTEADW
jgi:NAD(P)-dependent dehydrogenase (short-subunit alcohol dehydrogenase family)